MYLFQDVSFSSSGASFASFRLIRASVFFFECFTFDTTDNAGIVLDQKFSVVTQVFFKLCVNFDFHMIAWNHLQTCFKLLNMLYA